MYKTLVLGALLIIVVAVIVLASDIKSAYKVIPGQTTVKLPDPGAFIEWREFEPPSKAFKVLFPAMPQSATQAVEIPGTNKKRRYDMFASEKMDGSLFMVNLIAYPKDFNTKNQDVLLHSMVDELMQGNPANRLTKVTETTFLGQQALDFNIKNAQFDVIGKATMKDKIIYLLVYVSPLNHFDEADFKHFIDSFQIPGNDAIKD